MYLGFASRIFLLVLANDLGIEQVNDLCNHMVVDDSNEGGFVFDEVDVPLVEDEFRLCLVGSFITEKTINYQAMQNTLKALWKPVNGMCFRDLGMQCFMFQFFHEKNVALVERGGPWTFDRHVQLMYHLGLNEKPVAMPILDLSIWLQIHDLPAGFRFEKVCSSIGNYVGRYIKSDARDFDGGWKSFMLVRVMLDIRKPLKD